VSCKDEGDRCKIASSRHVAQLIIITIIISTSINNVSELPLFVPTCGSATVDGHHIVYLAVIVLVITAATTSSTIYCVALSQAQAPCRRVSHARCAPVGESDLTEWHKFRGREVDVLRGTPHALIPSRSRTSRTAVHWLGLQPLQRQRQNLVRSPSIRTSLLALTLLLRHRDVWRMGWAGNELKGAGTAEVNKKPWTRSTTCMRQRLSVAVQRGNAACILGILRPVVGGSY